MSGLVPSLVRLFRSVHAKRERIAEIEQLQEKKLLRENQPGKAETYIWVVKNLWLIHLQNHSHQRIFPLAPSEPKEQVVQMKDLGQTSPG